MANTQVVSGGSITSIKANEITTGDSAPTSPVNGQLWVDYASGTPIIKLWKASTSEWITYGFNNALMTTPGSIPYVAGVGSGGMILPGSSNQMLKMVGSTPEWFTPTTATAPPQVSTAFAGNAGVAATFARSDHRHSLQSSLTKASGTSAGFAIAFGGLPEFTRGARITGHIGAGPTGSVGIILDQTGGANHAYSAVTLGPAATSYTSNGASASVVIYPTSGGNFQFEFTVYHAPNWQPHVIGKSVGDALATVIFSGRRLNTPTVTGVTFVWSGSAQYYYTAEAL